MASFCYAQILRAGTSYLEAVKRRSRIEWLGHFVALACAIVAVAGSESLPPDSEARAQLIIAAGFGGGIAELLVWFIRRANDRDFAIGRRLRRQTVAVNGLGVPWETEDPHDLSIMARPGVEIGVDAAGYYASRRDSGWLRVVDNVQESAFFSWKLYQFSSWIILGLVIAFLAVAVLLCRAIIVQHDRLAEIVLTGHFILVVSSFVAGSGLLDQYFRWRDASLECARVVDDADTLISKKAMSEAQLQTAALTLFSDYAAATLSAPPPPTWLYRGKRKILTKEHAKRYARSETTS